jgi:hypothetical protein
MLCDKYSSDLSRTEIASDTLPAGELAALLLGRRQGLLGGNQPRGTFPLVVGKEGDVLLVACPDWYVATLPTF